jgi:hypothetical protein
MNVNWKSLVHIAGKHGLYRVLSTSRSGYFMESLNEPGKRMFFSASTRVAALGDIMLLTKSGETSLSETYMKMWADGYAPNPIDPHHANEEEIRELFARVVPDYDEARVYLSDMRKMLRWYEWLRPLMADDSAGNEQTD